jgi:amino acid transporter
MVTATDSHRGDQDRSHDLRRHVGPVGLLFASVGSIIGSGWLFGALNASQQAGPIAIFSWTIGGIMILLIALVYAELGTMFPLSGGVVRFPHMSFGSFASYTAGWITWLAAATVAPIEVEAALQYGTKYADFTTEHVVDGETVHTLTALGYGTAVIAMAIFVAINYIGVRWFARLNNLLVTWKLFIIVLVIIMFLVTAFHAGNFSDHGFAPTGIHGMFSAIATSGIVFSYLGFRQGIELAGETDNPRRNVPLAVIGAVLITAVIYVLLQIAFIAAVDPSDLSKGWSNLSYTNDFGPLAALATLLGLGWLATLLYIDAIISPADTGLIYTTVTSRISYAMARNENAPQGLAKTTNRGVPFVSLVVTFVVGLIVFLPFPSWQQLVGFITSATVLSFGSGPLVLVAMRDRIPEQDRPFRLPGKHVIPLLAFCSSSFIVYWSGWTVVWKLMVAILLGFVLLAIFAAMGKVTSTMHWRASLPWIVPWLGGLTLISYFGNFDGRGDFGFDTSVPLIIAFSVIVYAIAYAVRLPRETVLEMIEVSKREAAIEEEELGALP